MQLQIGQKWRHTRTGSVIAILGPKLDTADEWYVSNVPYKYTLTAVDITRDYVRN